MLERCESLLSRNRNASKGAPKCRHLEEGETTDLIIQALETREILYIVLDGINECEDPQSILQWLSKVMTSCAHCVVRLFISSINEKDIGKSFSESFLSRSFAVLMIYVAGVCANDILASRSLRLGGETDPDFATESAIETLPNLTTEALRQTDMRNDIRSLVLASLESDPRLRRQSPELKGEIDRALIQGAKGMYVVHR